MYCHSAHTVCEQNVRNKFDKIANVDFFFEDLKKFDCEFLIFGYGI